MEVGRRDEYGEIVMDWQLIETAPKDGHRLLLTDSFLWVAIGSWMSRAGGWVDDTPTKWPPRRLKAPTHWMPLPNLPEKASD